MEFGMFCEFPVRPGQTEAEAFSEGFELVDEAERLGIDAVWLSETHLSPGRSVLASPLVLASAIAGRTRRIRIGLAVYVLPLSHPLRIAEEGATLDHVSRGRLIFGVGRSGARRTYDAMEIPYEESRDRFAESLAVIRKAWAEPTFSHEGRWFRLQDVSVSPKPYQQPHPEIRVAAISPASFEGFGAQGFKIFIGLRGGGVSQLAPYTRAYRAAYRAAGHPGGGGIYLRVPVYVGETPKGAVSEPAPSITEYFLKRGTKSFRSMARAAGSVEKDPITWDEIREQRVIVGTPEQVVDRLHELRSLLGIDGILAEVNSGGKIPQPLVKRSLQLLSAEVAPAFR